MRVLTISVFFIGCAATASAPSPEPSRAGPSILVTHPTHRVMRRMQTLLEEGLLPAGVRVVGVAHAGETGDYSVAERYVAVHPRLGFRRLSCPLDDNELMQRNGCTEEFERLIAGSAGIVFTGGPDIPPAMYGEPALLTTATGSPRRIAWEVSLLFHLVGRGEDDGVIPLLARRPHYPVLAICMGMQALNVAMGGTLIQDIPSEVYGVRWVEDIVAQPAEEVHRNPHFLLTPVPAVARASLHPIRIAEDSHLASLAAGHPTVLSAHHQAVEKLGAGLVITATSMDGRIPEAVEHETFERVLGVQFHPDYLVLWRPGEPFAERRGESGNIASARMRSDPMSREFHRGIWKLFSRWTTRGRWTRGHPKSDRLDGKRGIRHGSRSRQRFGGAH